MTKTWQVKATLNSKKKNRQKAIIEALLANRGLNTDQEKTVFFNPIHPHDIYLTDLNVKKQDISSALKRLEKALKNEEKIIIYGDYDADGITSTAIMWEALHSLGFKVMPFLPHREEHGYGLKPSGIDSLISENGKPDLIITVDNGIVAFEGAKHCQKLEIDLIICDHHEPLVKESKSKKTTHEIVRPKSVAIIHSTQTAGAGIAYLFAKEILEKFNVGTHRDVSLLNSLLELSTIGVVADIVPLLSVSRSIAKYGLDHLPNTLRPGLKALFTQAQINPDQNFNTYHVGFLIAPRLNATGRLNHCLDSLRLLCTKNENLAIKLAIDLGSANKKRQDITINSTNTTIKLYKDNHQDKKIIIAVSEDYNPGVIGLIASKLVEQFYKPAIVVANMGEYAKASVRSIPGVNIIEMLRKFEEEFVELGGHPMAAGFTVLTKKLDELKTKIESLAQEIIDAELLVPTLSTETEIDFSDITLDLYEDIQKFAPFGLANPHPLFVTRNLEIAETKWMGSNMQHLKLILKSQDKILEAVYFYAPNSFKQIISQDKIDIAYQIDLNHWNGESKIQLLLKDIKIINN